MKIIKVLKVFGLIAIILFFDINTCLQVQASVLPTPPPTLELVKPKLEVMRGDAYQYALEKRGFDVQPGVNALQVLGAMEAASSLADYAFQGTDEYDATIQYVEDKSGLPEHMQGLNMELYFAKIDYLNMQIGLYLDAQGNTVGDKFIQYKANMNEMLDACVGTIKNNVLGRIFVEDLNLGSIPFQSTGGISGMPGMTGYGTYNNPTNVWRYGIDMFQVVSCSPGTQFFLLNKNGSSVKNYPVHVAFIYPANSPPTFRFGYDFVDTQDEAKSFISSRPVESAYPGMPIKNGYKIGYKPLCGISIRDSSLGSIQINYPWATLTANSDEFENWAYNQYIPSLAPNGGLVAGTINLNPNANPQPLPDTALDYDSLADHNKVISETVPKVEPSFDPLPENAPLYTPTSGLESVPQPKPNPMPEYAPVVKPDPDPNPNPDPEPNPDPSAPVVAISGLKDKFPFCVPFDLVDAFKGLVAPPDVPVWKITIAVPNTKIQGEIVIDLAPFENISKISRILLLLLFILILIVATRKLISN